MSAEGPDNDGGGADERRFDPSDLDWTIVAKPLLAIIREAREDGKGAERLPVVIDLNFKFHGGLSAAKARAIELIRDTAADGQMTRVDEKKKELSEQYLFAKLEPDLIEEVARRSMREGDETVGFIHRPIFMIWPDFEVSALTMKSISTVKADAAHRAFSAGGDGIVWAVLDSGIEGDHVHFQTHGNLDLSKLDPPLEHEDFTKSDGTEASALVDELGHGTHVAGIIGGEAWAPDEDHPFWACDRRRNERGQVGYKGFPLTHISGMAPKCKLVSFKVLDEKGKGPVSNFLAAIARIQEINEHGRWLKIHGVNLSVGYDFEPEWFSCGQSPLCVEVDRLVKSGVVVVAAAGNTGYGYKQTTSRGAVASGMTMSINDPGNSDLAITVGSTHREMPHVYGVSYFSSKGPTGDGRLKPDLVAPGERIISCAGGKNVRTHVEGAPSGHSPEYAEDSGTSMAAPHVSGVAAAFLSIRREFIGRPEQLKEIFVSNSTDLKRERYLQGSGLVDLMRAIQAV